MRIDAINRVYDIYSKQVSATSKANGKVNSKDEVDLSSQAKDFATIKKMLAKDYFNGHTITKGSICQIEI